MAVRRLVFFVTANMPILIAITGDPTDRKYTTPGHAHHSRVESEASSADFVGFIGNQEMNVYFDKSDHFCSIVIVSFFIRFAALR